MCKWAEKGGGKKMERTSHEQKPAEDWELRTLTKDGGGEEKESLFANLY